MLRFRPKYSAKFQAEAWINDHAVSVDPEGETEWDCTSFVEKHWTLEHIEAALESFAITDELKHDPDAPEWVKKWSGPFTITFNVDWSQV